MTNWGWACSTLVYRRCSSDHIRIVLSSLTETINKDNVCSAENNAVIPKSFPFGCKRIPRTQLSWPYRVKRHVAAETSHTLIVRSLEPEIKTIGCCGELFFCCSISFPFTFAEIISLCTLNISIISCKRSILASEFHQSNYDIEMRSLWANPALSEFHFHHLEFPFGSFYHSLISEPLSY